MNRLNLKSKLVKRAMDGQLEIDYERGIIYFHSNSGYTVLRICNLPKPLPSGKEELLDITHMKGCSWHLNASTKLQGVIEKLPRRDSIPVARKKK